MNPTQNTIRDRNLTMLEPINKDKDDNK